MSETVDGTGLVPAVEAILFAAGEPVHPKEIAAALAGADEDGVVAAIEALARRYDLEGAGLQQVASEPER